MKIIHLGASGISHRYGHSMQTIRNDRKQLQRIISAAGCPLLAEIVQKERKKSVGKNEK